MSFKYINPGYSELFDYATSDVGSISPASNQSRTGIAFFWYNPGTIDDSRAKLFFNLPTTDGEEFWAKADVFLPTFSSSAHFYFKQNQGGGFRIEVGGSTFSIYYFLTSDRATAVVKNAPIATISEYGLRLNALNTLWLHVFLGDSNSGYLEFKINNHYFGKYYGDTRPSGFVSSSQYLYKALILSNSNNTNYARQAPFSSIIISDEYISPYERIVPLTVSNTVTDMIISETGVYVADTANQTLLQSVSTTALEEEYGSDVKVTGVALIGNPAYEVDDIIGSLTSITKQNGTVADHENITLLTDSDAMIMSSFAMPSDTTVADLANIQFGWRTEE